MFVTGWFVCIDQELFSKEVLHHANFKNGQGHFG
jgi:hypothetical protein